jgi:hypothetical protein
MRREDGNRKFGEKCSKEVGGMVVGRERMD